MVGILKYSLRPSEVLSHGSWSNMVWIHGITPLLVIFWESFTLNPKKTGGGGHISRDYSATREALTATLYDNFLLSFPHILTPNLWRPGVRFRSYVTLCTCTSDRKWLQNVILCTKSMQIEFFSLSSYKYAYFHSQLLKLISFWFIVLQKVSATNFGEKNNKHKRSKNKEIHKKFTKQ